MPSLDAGDEDVSAQCDIPGGCQHQVTSAPCPSVTSGSAADQSEDGWLSSCPIRRQHFGSPTSTDGQNIAGMVTTYWHCHHHIPTHHNSLSSVTTLYCLKRWLCIKDQNWDIEASDFLKSCNFPGTRPECVATSLSWVDHWVGDEDDRLQSALMSSELSDWPGLDKWVPGLECWCPISKVTLNLCKLCNSQSLFHTSTWRHEVQKLRSNLQT